MSDTSVLDFTKVYAVVTTNTNTVSYQSTYHEPVVSAAQGPQGPPGIGSAQALSQLTDVSLTNLAEGSVLVYNVQNQVWVATKSLTQQAIECGQY
jgi:hypothetical protein